MTLLLKRLLEIGLGILALVIIAIVWLVFNRDNSQLSPSSDSNITSDVVTIDEDGDDALSETIAYEDLEWRTNSQGKKWALSSDESEFVVSSKDDGGIRFWEGKISPLKVAPGMTQTMKIVVSSPNGINSVTAMIETDNGTTTVELKKTGVLAARDLDDRHGLYTVDENNILAINTNEEAAAYRLALAQAEEGTGPVNAALAASGEREIFEGSWEVKDTSVRDYITIFVARDSAGQEKRNVLAWSDPCNDGGGGFWPNNGNATLYDECGLASTYGVDNGDLTIGGAGILNLQGSAVLAFNPGKQITLATGAIIILGPNASIQKKYLWAEDTDFDHYASTSQRWLTDDPNTITQSGGTIKRRQNSIQSTDDDCYDQHSLVHPGQTSFVSDSADGSAFDWDYNCDGVREQRWTYGGVATSTPIAQSESNIYRRLCNEDGVVWSGFYATPYAPDVNVGDPFPDTGIDCNGSLNAYEYPTTVKSLEEGDSTLIEKGEDCVRFGTDISPSGAGYQFGLMCR